MQLSPLQNVTLDVLVRAQPETCDGWMAVPNAGTTPSPPLQTAASFPVRVIRDSEIVIDGDLNPELRKKLSPKEWDTICAMNLLFRAEEARDSLGTKKAYQLASRATVHSLEQEEALKLLLSVYTYKNIGSDLDALISYGLANARLVCWARWRLQTADKDAKTPRQQRRAVGIYCSDYKTAIAAKMVLGTIRICFQCRMPFISKSRTKRCCSEACGVAYRVARSRAKKKAALREQADLAKPAKEPTGTTRRQ